MTLFFLGFVRRDVRFELAWDGEEEGDSFVQLFAPSGFIVFQK